MKNLLIAAVAFIAGFLLRDLEAFEDFKLGEEVSNLSKYNHCLSSIVSSNPKLNRWEADPVVRANRARCTEKFKRPTRSKYSASLRKTYDGKLRVEIDLPETEIFVDAVVQIYFPRDADKFCAVPPLSTVDCDSVEYLTGSDGLVDADDQIAEIIRFGEQSNFSFSVDSVHSIY